MKRDDRLPKLLAHLRKIASDAAADPTAERYGRLALNAVLWWADDRDSAVRELARAIELTPGDVDLKLQMAELRATRKEPEEALAVVDSVEAVDQDATRRRELLALRLAVPAGRPERARQAAERLFGLRLDSSTQVALAAQMHQLGMHELADAVLGRARRQVGNNAQGLLELMAQYRSQGNLDARRADRPGPPPPVRRPVAPARPRRGPGAAAGHRGPRLLGQAPRDDRPARRPGEGLAPVAAAPADPGRLLPGRRPARPAQGEANEAILKLRPERHRRSGSRSPPSSRRPATSTRPSATIGPSSSTTPAMISTYSDGHLQHLPAGEPARRAGQAWSSRIGLKSFNRPSPDPQGLVMADAQGPEGDRPGGSTLLSKAVDGVPRPIGSTLLNDGRDGRAVLGAGRRLRDRQGGASSPARGRRSPATPWAGLGETIQRRRLMALDGKFTNLTSRLLAASSRLEDARRPRRRDRGQPRPPAGMVRRGRPCSALVRLRQGRVDEGKVGPRGRCWPIPPTVPSYYAALMILGAGDARPPGRPSRWRSLSMNGPSRSPSSA